MERHIEKSTVIKKARHARLLSCAFLVFALCLFGVLHKSFALTPNLTPPVSLACPSNPLFDVMGGVPPGFCIPCSVYAETRELQEWTMIPTPGPGGSTYPRLSMHLANEQTAMRIWTVSILWEDSILPALMMMAEQLTAVSMKQAEIIGAFLDAKHQLETQQVFQKIAARAHKDYQPSTGMCEFGSGAKSLAASERKVEVNALLLSQRSLDRNVGSANQQASIGSDVDKESRVKQFREDFCDPRDNNDGLTYLCEHDQNRTFTLPGAIGQAVPGGIGAPQYTPPPPPGGGANPARSSPRKNKDIDFIRTVDFPWTLNIDFTNNTLTDNEEEVMALANNLYGHEVFIRPPSRSLESVNNTRLTAMQRYYMDARAVMAKRSVAENSFNAITAMKAEGTPGSRDYLVALLRELGVPNAGTNNDIDRMLGPNPSYYAQMEVLTKKLFQNPDFFTNLYDTPANVDRKGVAIQAIGLMQKFDLYKSYLRNEASLSVLLELAVQDLQDEVTNEFNQISGTGTPGVQ